ncbi:MAG: hypothetical protein EPO27_10640 [Betaproteobacteria bacterium]|nr:MAG: hypothetical protein EPO27_10640 [Betaproteobacteria bacterium]
MRLEGWESRLHAVIEASRHTPYALGTHDCFRVACAVVEALTGVDYWPTWGRYATKREAKRLIASRGHATFEEAFSWLFGTAFSDVRHAQRGDIVCIQTEDGEKHLGVCLGAHAAFTAPEGVLFVPTLTCLGCWRIG